MTSAARRLRPSRRLLAGVLVLVPLLTSGCGPSVPVALGVKSVPLDIAVGRDQDTPPRPHENPAPPAMALPAYTPVEPGPSVAVPPVVFASPPSRGAGSGAVCPELDPTRPSPAAATPEVDGAATEGSWPFRTQGGVDAGGTHVALPATQTRVVTAAASPSSGVFDFTQSGGAFGLPGASADFAASNSSTAPSNPAASPTSYVGLSRLAIPVAGGQVMFQPAAPLRILDTPAQQASTYQPDPNNPALPNTTGSWSDSQSDVADGTVLAIQASDLGQVRVNACGTPVDAWQVQATITLTGTAVVAGAQRLPSQTSLTLDVTYAVATGLGGMIVAETVRTAQGSTPTGAMLAGQSYSVDDAVTLSSPAPQAS